MLKCLVSENDTVVETLLSESVLEEEYLQEEVRKLSYLRTLRHHVTIWRTQIKMQRNENTTYCQGADWHGSLARGGGSPPLQGSKCEIMSWHSCHSKIQTQEKKDFFAALAHRFAVGNSCSHSHQVKTQNQRPGICGASTPSKDQQEFFFLQEWADSRFSHSRI